MPIGIFYLAATAPNLAVISKARRYDLSWLPSRVGQRTDPTIAQPLSSQALSSWRSISTSRAAVPAVLTSLSGCCSPAANLSFSSAYTGAATPAGTHLPSTSCSQIHGKVPKPAPLGTGHLLFAPSINSSTEPKQSGAV